MTETATKQFDTRDFYEITDEAVFDTRVLGVAEKLISIDHSMLSPQQRAAAERRSDRRVHPFSNVDQRGSDGEDYSGFVAKVDIDATDGRKLTVIRSWQADNETGIPASNCSWSAEFDDREVADDFWENWQPPCFDGLEFKEAALAYLEAHPEVPRRTLRLDELGLLDAWHGQRFGEHVLLDHFSTVTEALVKLPRKYDQDESFEPGQVYIKPVKNRFGYVLDHVARTCLAAFTVEGGQRYWRNQPDATFVQWSDGQLASYWHPMTDENGPVPLRPAQLEQD